MLCDPKTGWRLNSILAGRAQRDQEQQIRQGHTSNSLSSFHQNIFGRGWTPWVLFCSFQFYIQLFFAFYWLYYYSHGYISQTSWFRGISNIFSKIVIYKLDVLYFQALAQLGASHGDTEELRDTAPGPSKNLSAHSQPLWDHAYKRAREAKNSSCLVSFKPSRQPDDTKSPQRPS